MATLNLIQKVKEIGNRQNETLEVLRHSAAVLTHEFVVVPFAFVVGLN